MSSLRFPLMALYLFTCYHHKCHAGASHRCVSSPRFLYWGESFNLVQNLATVPCKHETTNRFGVKSVCQLTGMGSACVMFAILKHTCILSTWSVPSNNEMWNDPVIMQTRYEIKKSRRYETRAGTISQVNTPLGSTIFKNPNLSLCQFSSVLPICDICF